MVRVPPLNRFDRFNLGFNSITWRRCNFIKKQRYDKGAFFSFNVGFGAWYPVFMVSVVNGWYMALR